MPEAKSKPQDAMMQIQSVSLVKFTFIHQNKFQGGLQHVPSHDREGRYFMVPQLVRVEPCRHMIFTHFFASFFGKTVLAG